MADGVLPIRNPKTVQDYDTVLRRAQGLSFTEIAKQDGVSPSCSNSRFYAQANCASELHSFETIFYELTSRGVDRGNARYFLAGSAFTWYPGEAAENREAIRENVRFLIGRLCEQLPVRARKCHVAKQLGVGTHWIDSKLGWYGTHDTMNTWEIGDTLYHYATDEPGFVVAYNMWSKLRPLAPADWIPT